MSAEKKVLIIGIVLIIASAILTVFNFAYNAYNKKAAEGGSIKNEITSQNAPINEEKNCSVKEAEIIVKGSSMAGIFNSGEKVKVLENYYACNSVKRDDIVIYRYAGKIEPLIKIVKGIPGDKFSLKKSGNTWNIFINDKVVVNSENKPYVIGDSGYKILSLYVNDYKGIIPGGAYLILGNSISGSLDSTKFGLVGKSDFIGKVKK